MGTHPNFRFGTEKNERICLVCFGGCPKIFHKHHRIAQFRWEPLRIQDWSAATFGPSRDMNNQQHMSQHHNSSFRVRVLLHSGGTNKRFSDLRHGRCQSSRGTRLKGRCGSKPRNTFHEDARIKNQPSRTKSSTTHREKSSCQIWDWDH